MKDSVDHFTGLLQRQQQKVVEVVAALVDQYRRKTS